MRKEGKRKGRKRKSVIEGGGKESIRKRKGG